MDEIKNVVTQLSPRLEKFLKDESIGGKLIILAAAISMVVVNSGWAEAYSSFWQQKISLGNISMDLRHWVNEGLMAIFFLVVGLEIKREIVGGELREFKTAILPIGAAIGGMIVPALIYLLFNAGSEASNGWGIPIATDIAFAVAVLGLLGNRIPLSLKVFLLTLAIADDIGAIVVIALFYAEAINYSYLLLGLLIVAVIYYFRKPLGSKFMIVALLGIALWVTTHLSGIHASIVGAIMGLLAPVSAAPNKRSVADHIEKFLLPVSTFFVVPVFAFANAGFVLSLSAFTANPQIFWGVALGLVLGKVIGVTAASWLLLKFKIAALPRGIGLHHIIGIGFLAGIGFTVSIFITELAFAGNQSYIDTAKAGIFIASFAAAIIGSFFLLNGKTRSTQSK